MYSGYVYLWYDTKSKFFYVGGHFGKVEDSYICSSKTMKRAYKLRPDTFRIKILQFTYGDTKELRSVEQKWLNMIKPEELMTTKNVQNHTCRYYNVKNNSAGGNGVGTNKGKSRPAWNKGITKEMKKLHSLNLLCFISDKPKIKKRYTRKKSIIKNVIQKTNKIPKNKKKKNILILWCCECDKCYISNRTNRKYCSVDCSVKGSKNRKFPNRTAWNKGLKNLTAAENGKKGANKQSQTVTGRKKVYNNDGSWNWKKP